MTKKEKILEAIRNNPNLSVEEVAEIAACTEQYAKRILAEREKTTNNEIAEWGKKIGVAAQDLEDWYQYVIISIQRGNTLSKFKDWQAELNH